MSAPAIALHGVRGLTGAARLVLGELMRLSDCHGLAVCQIGWLTSATGVSRASIYRALAALEEAGLVVRHRRWRRGITAPSLFEIRLPDDDADRGLERASVGEGVLVDVVGAPPVGRDDNDELRACLVQAQAESWTGEAAARIAATIRHHGPGQFWSPIRRQSRRTGRAEAEADALSAAWQVVRDHAAELIEAGRPWALWTAMVDKNCLQKDAKIMRSGEVAVDPMLLPEGAQPLGGAHAVPDSHVSYADFGEGILADLVDALVTAGMNETIAWAGTLRISEIAATNHSQRHTEASKDWRLMDLGIDPAVARLWMTLLVGSRRGATVSIVDLDADAAAIRCQELVAAWKQAA